MTCNCVGENNIQITQGCSKTLTFNFDSDLDGYNAEFCVRADLGTTPILTKVVSDLSGTSFTLELSPTDNGVFVLDDYIAQYIWGLDLYNTDERINVFPQTGQVPPQFTVYRHIVGN